MGRFLSGCYLDPFETLTMYLYMTKVSRNQAGSVLLTELPLLLRFLSLLMRVFCTEEEGFLLSSESRNHYS